MAFLIGWAVAWLLPLHLLGGLFKQRPPTALRHVLDRLRVGWRRLGLAGTPAAVAPAATPAPASEPLSARLHQLESVFAPTVSNSAHPRELAEHPQFLQAVDLLIADGVSFHTVMQYAVGANWGLGCAALAALRRRADGAQGVDEVVAQFDKF